MIPRAGLAHLDDVATQLFAGLVEPAHLRRAIDATTPRGQPGSERIRHVDEIVVRAYGALFGGHLPALGGPQQLGMGVANVLTRHAIRPEVSEHGVAGEAEVDGRAAIVLDAPAQRFASHGGEPYRSRGNAFPRPDKNPSVDQAARFRALYAETYAALRRWAHHRGISGADADDVVAEVFTIAWRRIDDIPADATVPWLYGVARNVARNHRRGVARRAALLQVVPPAPDVPPPAEPADPDAATLRAVLDTLGDDDQEILRLVAWDGLDPSEAAVALECSAATARVRLFRARKRFAAALAAVTPTTDSTRSQRERWLQEVPDVR